MIQRLLLLLLSLTSLLSAKPDILVPNILVSVAPYKPIVEELVDNSCTVSLVVPKGFSSHTFEPTAKQMLSLCNAFAWCTIGESFEKKIIDSIQQQNPNFLVIELWKNCDLLGHTCHHHHSFDPHIWMSPKMMQKQVEHIASVLEKQNITIKLKPLLEKLDKLDKEIESILEPIRGKTVFVSHPAYSYFCRDYGLTEVSIEIEGKDPTPKQITELASKAKNATTIFTQPQYSQKASDAIARQVGAQTVMLDPYAENYFENMLIIANEFKKGAV